MIDEQNGKKLIQWLKIGVKHKERFKWKGEDLEGYRREFIKIVRLAKELDNK